MTSAELSFVSVVIGLMLIAIMRIIANAMALHRARHQRRRSDAPVYNPFDPDQSLYVRMGWVKEPTAAEYEQQVAELNGREIRFSREGGILRHDRK